MMPAHRQSWTADERGHEPQPAVQDDRVEPPQAGRTAAPGLVGQVMIERAKSVVVVARRVDEETAAQILADAADDAGIPVRLAADQIVTALQAPDNREGITQDALAHAVEATHPVGPTPVIPAPTDSAPAG
ncbi:ANTAR domain-containing protein [Promicromonospora sp. NPDC019610]|uniref:ANTAR domain-containing protein n=1 Tax=Promicromonospora sp. NPDC019610 TaxID=3364405 RepID=UPI00378B78A0